MRARPDEAVEAFNHDAAHGGYVYATSDVLSTRLSRERMNEAIAAVADYRGKRVVDVACGDGTFTGLIADPGGATSVVGIDAAADAVAVAVERVGSEALSFDVGDASNLPYADDEFDVAQLRGVIHHFDRPQAAISEALRVARSTVILEPNGYNPGLKLYERLHPYHRAHGERSYTPRRLDRWVADAGGRVVRRMYVGLVPTFAPDWLAGVTKRCEKVVERTPLIRALACAQYVFVAERL
jgi:SAM-dependent methyltransferase